MKRVLNFIVLILIVIFMVSCDKENIQENISNNNEEIKVQ